MMDRLHEQLIRYDAFCLLKVKALLAWLFDWLSISQYQVELTLTMFYGLSGFPELFNTHGWLMRSIEAFIPALTTYVGVLMWRQMQLPAGLRIYRMYTGGFMRSVLQIMFGILIIFALLANFRPAIVLFAVTGRLVAFVLFQYSIALVQGGQRGRKRKGRLAKIKSLLSPVPIPDPLPL